MAIFQTEQLHKPHKIYYQAYQTNLLTINYLLIMLIKSTNLTNTRLMDFYQVMSITAGFVQKEDVTGLNLKTYTDDFSAAFVSFDKALKQAQKTGYTELIIEADDERDNILAGMLGSLRAMLRFPDKDVADAAAKLILVTDKYGSGVARLPQREETAVLTNLVEDLRNTENAPLLQKVGLTAWVDKLDLSNKAFDDLYTHRTEKEAEFITGLTRTERSNMQTAFEKLCRAIDSNGFINGDTNYKPLADKINTEVAKVQQSSKARATSKKKTNTADSTPKTEQ